MTQSRAKAPLLLLLIAYAIFFNMAFMSGILNVAWRFMRATFGMPLEALGVLLLATPGGGLIGTFFSGRLITRLGLGRYLLGGSALVMIGLLGYTFAPSWIVLLAVAFVTSLGTSAYNAGLNIFVAANYSTGRLSWLHAAFGVGQTISPTITTLLIVQWGLSWHVNYLIAFGTTLGVTVLLLVTLDQWRLDVHDALDRPAERAASQHASLWETLHIPTVLTGMMVFFIFNGIVAGIGQLSTTVLTTRGFGEAEAGYWISGYWGSFTVGRIIMGFIAHRLDNTRLIRACLFGAAVGAALLWQNASTTVNLIGLALMGLSCAPLYPTLVAEAHRSVEARYRAHAIGIQMSAGGVGQALIPGSMAWLAEHVTVNLVGGVAAIGMIGVLALYQVALRRRQGALSLAR